MKNVRKINFKEGGSQQPAASAAMKRRLSNAGSKLAPRLLSLLGKAQRHMAQFRQNQAKAEISVYRQFAWVNRVKYKRNQGVHLRGDTGCLIQLKIPF